MRAQEYLKEMGETISSIKLDENFEKAVKLVVDSNGEKPYKIITTGMGKAGHAMRKFSSTLCSLNFSSSYLHPAEASHGDSGILELGDVLFVASTSGKTREVLEVIEIARNIGIDKFIGITSHVDSPIRDQVDVCLDMGVIKEIGDLGLAPTTSILVMLAITDCLAIEASSQCGLTKEQYAVRHHSGYLGSQARGEL